MEHDGFESFFQRLSQATSVSSQSDLARELGVGRAAVSLAKKKGKAPDRWVLTLARRYGLDPEWLATGRGLGGSEGTDYVTVPKVVARLSAGGGSFETDAAIEGYYAFRSEWARARGNPDSMVLMGVVGNSMEPEIKQGDVVLIDQSKTSVLSGGIYAVGVEDTVMVKRIEKLPGALVLRSDNAEYSPITLRGDEIDQVRLVGKVVWVSREYA